MTINQMKYQRERRRNKILNVNIREFIREKMSEGKVFKLHGLVMGLPGGNNIKSFCKNLIEKGYCNIEVIRGAHRMRGTEGFIWMMASSD